MQFINIVVHSVENMNFRVFLQYEFTHLGLDLYLEVSPAPPPQPRSTHTEGHSWNTPRAVSWPRAQVAEEGQRLQHKSPWLTKQSPRGGMVKRPCQTEWSSQLVPQTPLEGA